VKTASGKRLDEKTKMAGASRRQLAAATEDRTPISTRLRMVYPGRCLRMGRVGVEALLRRDARGESGLPVDCGNRGWLDHLWHSDFGGEIRSAKTQSLPSAAPCCETGSANRSLMQSRWWNVGKRRDESRRGGQKCPRHVPFTDCRRPQCGADFSLPRPHSCGRWCSAKP
jgi:hypothetical protein